MDQPSERYLFIAQNKILIGFIIVGVLSFFLVIILISSYFAKSKDSSLYPSPTASGLPNYQPKNTSNPQTVLGVQGPTLEKKPNPSPTNGPSSKPSLTPSSSPSPSTSTSTSVTSPRHSTNNNPSPTPSSSPTDSPSPTPSESPQPTDSPTPSPSS
jgi:hypothetical protein